MSYTPTIFATATPLMDGVAAAGTSSRAAREDHVHPSPTFALLNQAFTVTVLAVNNSFVQTYTVPGAQVGMGAVVNIRADSVFGPGLYAWVSATNTVSVSYRALIAITTTTTAQIDIRVLT